MEFKLLDEMNSKRHLYFGMTLKGAKGLDDRLLSEIADFWVELFSLAGRYIFPRQQSPRILICAGRNWGGELLARPVAGVQRNSTLPPFDLQAGLGLGAIEDSLGEKEIAQICRPQGSLILDLLHKALSLDLVRSRTAEVFQELRFIAINFYDRTVVHEYFPKNSQMRKADDSPAVFSNFDLD